VLVAGLNRRWWEADSRVEQSPEGEGVLRQGFRNRASAGDFG
jgi:hypothetical protein